MLTLIFLIIILLYINLEIIWLSMNISVVLSVVVAMCVALGKVEAGANPEPDGFPMRYFAAGIQQSIEKSRVEVLGPIQERMGIIVPEISSLGQQILFHFERRASLLKNETFDHSAYAHFTAECIRLKERKLILLTEVGLFLNVIKSRMDEQGRLTTERGMIIARIMKSHKVTDKGEFLGDGGTLSDRERKKIKDRTRKSIKREGIEFLNAQSYGVGGDDEVFPILYNIGGKLIPQSVAAHNFLALKQMKDQLLQIVDRNRKFDEEGMFKEKEFLYLSRRFLDPESDEQKDLALWIYNNTPDQNKEHWRQIYRKHVERSVAKETQPNKQDREAAQAASAMQNRAICQEEQDREQVEHRLSEARRRALRCQLEAEVSAVASAASAASAASSSAVEVEKGEQAVIRPSEVLEDRHLGVISLDLAELVKYQAAIAAIRNGEQPSDFRGALRLKEVKGITVLHCGISDKMRVYYILHNGKAYIIDVSNHDMDGLKIALERFKRENQ